MTQPLRILWLKTGPLHPLDTGGKLRTYHMLRELSREHRVTYLSLCPPDTDRKTLAAASEYSAEQIWIPWHETPKRTARFFAELATNFIFSSLPYAIAKYRSAGMETAIRDQDASSRYDLIICDFLTPAVNLFAGTRHPVTPTLLFQHNVESLIVQRTHDISHGSRRAYFRAQWQRMRRFEKLSCEKCNGVVAVSDADCNILRSEMGLQNVLGSVPTGVDIDYFANTGGSRTPRSMVFLGSMDWMPNIDGAQWFASEIWPKIKAAIPDATVTIVGRRPGPEIKKLAADDPAIRVTGTVDDVRPYLSEAELMIVPLRVGGGTRIKIFEGMAAGVPVLSTRVGAEGLSVTDGENIALADAPEDFAQKAIDLLSQSERRLSLADNGCRLVREKFSWSAVTKVFSNYCEQIASKPQPRE